MKDLRFDIVIDAPPRAVWHALTGEAGVAALYFGSRLETTFAPGAPYAYSGDENGARVVHVEGEIVEHELERRLVLTHRAGPRWRTGDVVYTSRLAYLLEPAGKGTLLTVVHDRFQEGDPGRAHNAAGWPEFLAKVKQLVEAGGA